MARPIMLDLFCGAGGAAEGYRRAGFDVVGVDNRPQPRYPGRFVLGDWQSYLSAGSSTWNTVHASPPCQAYSATARLPNVRKDHKALVEEVRAALVATELPWVIENVPGAPMAPTAVTLCGLSFGLRVFRHRLFEASFPLFSPPHTSHRGERIGERGMVSVAGHGCGSNGGRGWHGAPRVIPPDHRSVASWRSAMGIGWMTRDELAQSIPPAYTEWVGRHLRAVLA